MDSPLWLKKTESSIFSEVISISRASVSADYIVLHVGQCPSVRCFPVFQTKKEKETHPHLSPSPCDIITPSIRVYFQMSGTCPEECHTTSGRILDEEESMGSGYTGYPQTVNKDQTMLSASRLEQSVFSTLPVEITAGEMSDKPQPSHKHQQLPLLFRETKAEDQFCHYPSLLWLFFFYFTSL